jgi:hypothetical protein
MLATAVDGKAEPCLSQNSDALTERDLPLTISRAITRAMTWRDGQFATLGLAERGMLVEVLRCVPRKQPEEGAFIRRDTLAVRLACSVATVTRILARLEELGWILRDQIKSRARGFQVGSIALTKAAAEWLGLYLPLPTAQRHAPVIDACSSPIQSLQRQLPCPASSDDKSSQTQPGLLGRLPEALRWLAQKVSPFGIFKLMGLARRRGVQLETVTTQCRDQIAAANNGYAYIRGLLAVDKDWSYLAAQDASKAAAEAKAAELRATVSHAVDALEGQDFIRPDGLVCKVRAGWVSVYTPDEAARSVGVAIGCRPVDSAFVDEVERGEVVRRAEQSTGAIGASKADERPAVTPALSSSGRRNSEAVQGWDGGARTAGSVIASLFATIAGSKLATNRAQ